MRRLTPLSRRRFGQGLGACLALTAIPRTVAAKDGPQVVTVRVSGFAFVPESVQIRTGDTVVWINEDLAPHTATERGGSWDTGSLEMGGSGRVVFAAPGEFEYLCAFHPHMTGTIAVRSG